MVVTGRGVAVVAIGGLLPLARPEWSTFWLYLVAVLTLLAVDLARAYAAARERPNACVYATSRTPERESSFKWVGPIDSAEWVLMARAIPATTASCCPAI